MTSAKLHKPELPTHPDAWDLAISLEDDICAASDFANAIVTIVTASLESGTDRSVLVRLAYEIQDRCTSLEKRRAELTRMLNPNQRAS